MKQIDINCEHTELVTTDELLPHPLNPNHHPDSQIKLLADIISRTGFRQAIVVSTLSGHIIKGHGRWEAAQLLGMENVPVDYQDYPSEAFELADMVADNEVARLASNNASKLQEIEQLLEADDEADLRLAALEHLIEQNQETDDEKEQREKAEKQEAANKLTDHFGFVPFSVLKGDDSKWLARKRLWRQLGIESEIGREGELTYATSACITPRQIALKNAWDKETGNTSTIDEFFDHSGEQPTPTTSIFDPVLCELFYRWFLPPREGKKPLRILDPFAGGSVRGVVAAQMGHQYVGIDLRAEQIKANEKNAEDIYDAIGEPPHRPTWLQGDSRDIDKILKAAGQDKRKFDLIFTCPPYGDLEVYSDDPNDLSTLKADKFKKEYQAIIASATKHLLPDRFAIFVVGDYRCRKTGRLIDLSGQTAAAAESAGLSHYNQFIYQTPVGSLIMRLRNQFNKSRKAGRRHQNIIAAHNSDNPDELRAAHHDVETIAAADFMDAKAATLTHETIVTALNATSDQGIKDNFGEVGIGITAEELEEAVEAANNALPWEDNS